MSDKPLMTTCEACETPIPHCERVEIDVYSAKEDDKDRFTICLTCCMLKSITSVVRSCTNNAKPRA
jgi:hypothetical protein